MFASPPRRRRNVLRLALGSVAVFAVYLMSYYYKLFWPTYSDQMYSTRQFYIDLGANWAQTLDLHTKLMEVENRYVQEMKMRTSGHFRIFAFEASPYIAPFVEAVVEYRNSGSSNVHKEPKLPFPNSGSSKDLLRHNRRDGSPCPTKIDELWRCYFERYRSELSALKPLNYLNSTQLIKKRLSLAALPTTDMKANSYVFIPAAASDTNGWLTIAQSKLGLLIGGGTPKGAHANSSHPGNDMLPPVSVPTIDVVGWLDKYFYVDDIVIVKMDIEGAEHSIIPTLIRSGAHRLIDVLAWECHGKVGNCAQLRQSLQKFTNIVVLEEGRDYDGW